MGPVEQLLALIPTIYDAALDPGLWATVMQHCADLVDSHCGLMWWQNLNDHSGQAVTYGLDPGVMSQYFALYAPPEKFRRRVVAVPIGEIECDRDIMPRQEFEKSEFYNEFLKKQLDASAIMTSVLWRNRENVVPFTLCRGTTRPEFEADDKRAMAAIVSHLTRAFQISFQMGTLQAQSEQATELLDRNVNGILIVDFKGKVLFANARAEELLRRGDCICAGTDGIRSASQSITDRLRTAVARAAKGEDGGAIAVPQADGGMLYALIAPCRPEQSWLRVSEPRVLILLRDTETRPALRPAYLQSIFDLSPAEARVAVKLCQGLDLARVAQALSISRNTARVHLNAILAKTGTHRQAELMRRLAGIADLCAGVAAAPHRGGIA